MSDLINIPSLFKGVTDLMKVTIPAVVFDYGHYNEITARLVEKENSRTQKDKKYPISGKCFQ